MDLLPQPPFEVRMLQPIYEGGGRYETVDTAHTVEAALQWPEECRFIDNEGMWWRIEPATGPNKFPILVPTPAAYP